MSHPPHPHQPEHGPANSPHSPAAPYGQPGAGASQPGYDAQQGYGAQPAYGAGPGQPGFPAAPPPKKSKVGKVLLIVLAVVLVLCVGGGAAIWFAVKDDVGEVVEATQTRVVAPETLAGRPKVTQPELVTAAEQMTTQIKQDVPEHTSAVGAFYGDPAKQDLVMIVGVSGVIADPKKELDDAVSTLTRDLGTTNMAAVEPGPLGGDAKCGDGKSEGVDLGVCVWADRGSLGMVVIYFKSGTETAKEFPAIRAAVEQRN